jgi:hypothetical protein
MVGSDVGAGGIVSMVKAAPMSLSDRQMPAMWNQGSPQAVLPFFDRASARHRQS